MLARNDTGVTPPKHAGIVTLRNSKRNRAIARHGPQKDATDEKTDRAAQGDPGRENGDEDHGRISNCSVRHNIAYII